MPGRYLVRPELLEFLAIVAKREFESNSDHAAEARDSEKEAELKVVLGVALQPHVGDHAQIVLNNLHPMTDIKGRGFTSEVILPHVPDIQKPVVRRALNAGSTLGFVEQRETRNERHHEFEVHRQLYKTLCMIAAENPATHTWERDARAALAALQQPVAALPPREADRSYQSEASAPRDGGALSEARTPVTQMPANLLSDGSAAAASVDARANGYATDERDANREYAAPAQVDDPQTPPDRDTATPGDDLGPNAFHQKLVDHFASELGYQDDDLEDVMAVGRELDVRLLRDALTKVLMQMPVEAQSVSKADRFLKSNIERAYEESPEHFARTPEQSLALHDFSENLKTYRTLFLLSPGGAYRNLLETLSRGLHSNMDDGTLHPADEQRLEFLVTHIRELEDAD
ncbi:MAG: hypothetical protein AAFO75_12340, partial [Pseudomonadota bacterium]